MTANNSGRFTKGTQAKEAAKKSHEARSTKADIKAYCQRNSMRAARAILKIATDPSASASDRLKAGMYLIDRGYGRPEAAQSNAGGTFHGATIIVDTGIRRALEPPTVDVTPELSGELSSDTEPKCNAKDINGIDKKSR